MHAGPAAGRAGGWAAGLGRGARVPAMTTLVLCCCLGGPVAPAAPAPLPKTEVLVLRDRDDYRALRAPEQELVGVLAEESGGKSSFRLEVPLSRFVARMQPLEVQHRGARLRPFVGQRVRVVGRLVAPERPGQGREVLWVGRVELLEVRHP